MRNSGPGRLLIVALTIIFGSLLTVACNNNTSDNPTPSPKPAHAQVAKADVPQIQYIAKGDPAKIAFGPADNLQDRGVPLNVKDDIKPAQYYMIAAQLPSSGGHVVVTIKVHGKVLARAIGNGPNTIATAEIFKDPVTHQWVSTGVEK